jgi:hypothetical protein
MTALRSTQTRPTLTWRQSVAEWLLFNQGNPNSNAARSLWNEMVSNYWNPPPNEQTNPFEFYDENGTVFQGTTGRY